MPIRFVRNIETKNFIVDVLGFRIGVHRDTMVRVVGVSPRAVLGSTTITEEQLISIGFFIVPVTRSEAVVA